VEKSVDNVQNLAKQGFARLRGFYGNKTAQNFLHRFVSETDEKTDPERCIHNPCSCAEIMVKYHILNNMGEYAKSPREESHDGKKTGIRQ
jgi:hypothetical protein